MASGKNGFSYKVKTRCGRNQCSVLRGKGCIIFAYKSVFVFAFPVDGYIAENDNNILRCFDYLLPVSLTVFQKIGLFPQITDHGTGNSQFGKQKDINLIIFRQTNQLQHFFSIQVRTSGDNFHLSAGNF